MSVTFIMLPACLQCKEVTPACPFQAIRLLTVGLLSAAGSGCNGVTIAACGHRWPHRAADCASVQFPLGLTQPFRILYAAHSTEVRASSEVERLLLTPRWATTVEQWLLSK